MRIKFLNMGYKICLTLLFYIYIFYVFQNNFDDLVAGLRAKVSAEAQQSRSDKSKDTKGKTKSNSGKTSADAAAGKESADKV